ncbi:hypothetical protein HPB50_005049 [Hyalomma asiaticum]|uniref:Uncharacterized protein n=1 Tax=Hyalomma asiaticum TaxID=266040 RepID=A0ACB7RVK4_HYAAI|nr:hypothetical protein HPB50_005049 [Hyalomma asiaticum]
MDTGLAKSEARQPVRAANKSDAEFSFTILLHTYLRLSDVNQFSISGLRGCPYVDKVKQGEKSLECEDQVHIKGATDRVYSKTSDTHTCSMAGRAWVIVKKTENFPDTVLWNPWVSGAASMADFGDDEYMKMVCVEPGYVSEPKKLTAKETFEASVTMEAVE